MSDDDCGLHGKDLARHHWRTGQRHAVGHGLEHADEMRRLHEEDARISADSASVLLGVVILAVVLKALEAIVASPWFKLALTVAFLGTCLYTLYRVLRTAWVVWRWAADRWESRSGRSVFWHGFPSLYFRTWLGKGARGPVRLRMPGRRTMTLNENEWIEGGEGRFFTFLSVAKGVVRNPYGERAYEVWFESMPGGLKASYYVAIVAKHGYTAERFSDPQTALDAARWYAALSLSRGRIPDGVRYDPAMPTSAR